MAQAVFRAPLPRRYHLEPMRFALMLPANATPFTVLVKDGTPTLYALGNPAASPAKMEFVSVSILDEIPDIPGLQISWVASWLEPTDDYGNLGWHLFVGKPGGSPP